MLHVDSMLTDGEPYKTSISKATTVEEISDFRDTHSLADYWDQTHEVDVKILAG